jgi:hypothetical protein
MAGWRDTPRCKRCKQKWKRGGWRFRVPKELCNLHNYTGEGLTLNTLSIRRCFLGQMDIGSGGGKRLEKAREGIHDRSLVVVFGSITNTGYNN